MWRCAVLLNDGIAKKKYWCKWKEGGKKAKCALSAQVKNILFVTAQLLTLLLPFSFLAPRFKPYSASAFLCFHLSFEAGWHICCQPKITLTFSNFESFSVTSYRPIFLLTMPLTSVWQGQYHSYLAAIHRCTLPLFLSLLVYCDCHVIVFAGPVSVARGIQERRGAEAWIFAAENHE